MVRSEPDRCLITGFPAFTAKRLVHRLLESDPEERVYLLVRSKFRVAAHEFLTELDDGGERPAKDRVTVLEGDVCDMDLGLAGGEYRELAREVTAIHHIAGIYYQGVSRDIAERVNVEGMRAVLQLAEESPHLRRFTHYSTATVSGTRSGVILEDELDVGQRFHNIYEETKFEAEKLAAQAMRHLPVTVLRPGLIVGDSRTGEIDKFDGPYYLIVLIVASPLDVHLPLPGRGSAPLHLVPIDFVVDAAYALSRDPRAVGKTFHLTDPVPFSTKTVYELIARRADRKLPRGSIPSSLARAILRAPGVSSLARAPLTFLESLNHIVVYNCRNTLALLEGTGIRCPSFDTYVDPLVRYVRDVHDARRQKLEEEALDPFE